MGKALVTLGGIQFFDNAGDPLNGGLIYVVATGTTTPVTSYKDAALTLQHTDPITLDAYGRPPGNAIWVNEEVDIEVKTSAGVSLGTVDNFNPSATGLGTFSTKNSNVLSKTTTYAVTTSDDGKCIVATGSSSWTLSLPPAVDAGDGFWFSFVNAGSGFVTLDPDGAETVNGVSSMYFAPMEGAEFRCNGTTWYAIVNGAVQKLTGGAFSGSSLDIESLISVAFRKIVIAFDKLIPGTDATDLWFRLSDDAGATYEADASDYKWARYSAAEGAGGIQEGSTGDTRINLFASMGNSTNEELSGEVDIYAPANTGVTNIIFDIAGKNSTPSFAHYHGAGQLQAPGAHTAFQLLPSSGSWNSGNYTVYGYRV